MKKNRQIFLELVKNYFLIIFIALILLVTMMYVGRKLLFTLHPIWYPEDTGYALLHFIDGNKAIIVCILVIVVSALAAVIEFHKISSGIGAITAAVNHIYASHEDEIVLPPSFGYLEGLLKQIQYDARVNKQALTETNQRKNDMIMYMAHDLKTPLTSVIGYLTLLHEEKELPPALREKYTAIAWNKALRLEELINGFFDITRFNLTHICLQKTKVNMTVMLTQILPEFQPHFDKKGLTCRLDASPDVMVTCDVDKIERVLDNLLNNIASYSYDNSEILIVLRANGSSGMHLLTRNHGRTIPPEMCRRIFDQFFRMDSSRSSESGGSGLGLAIAREIVSLHGGTIACRSHDELIEFDVILPGL